MDRLKGGGRLNRRVVFDRGVRAVRGAVGKWTGGRGNQGQGLEWKEWMRCRNGKKKRRRTISH